MSNGEGRSTEGFGIDRDASVMLIVRTALEYGVDDPRQIAYMLATAQHETRNFAAPEEDYGRSQARKLGYSGGEDFYGRGYVHLTHDYNYRKFDELLGLNGELVLDPDKAKDPELAARILVVGMRDGLFTGKSLDRYINDESQDRYNARRVVNGITRQAWTVKAAEDCERHAVEWERAVPTLIEESRKREAAQGIDPRRDVEQAIDRLMRGTATFGPAMTDGMPDYLRVRRPPAQSEPGDRELRQGTRGSAVRELQQQLDRLGIRDGQGRALATDGVFGPSTREAVENFQLWHGLPTSGVADRGTLAALRDPQPGLAAARPGDAADPAAGRASAAGPGDPAHPDHAMYQRIRDGVRAIDDDGGKTYDEASERVCRALLAQCKDPGGSGERPVQASPAGAALRRVDHVVMGSTGNLFAVEGRLDDPAHKRVCVAVAQVAHVDVEASDRRLSEANARIAQELDAARQHAHARHPAGPDPGAPAGMG